MRILFTGTSSFTGLWFLEALARRGADIVAVTRRRLATYEGLPAARLGIAEAHARLFECCPFGADPFLDLLEREGPFDVVCLHGAEAADHRSDRFDALRATQANCCNADLVFERLVVQGTRRVIVTSSLFEADVGQGTPPNGPFNGYGLSKTLSWQILRYYAQQHGLAVGRFIIPHPLGPFEKPGLTTSFAHAWLQGQLPTLQQPLIVRDFVPVDALAQAYAAFVLDASAEVIREIAPSGWVETTEAFVTRFAAAMRPRFGMPCDFACTSWPKPTCEPRDRHNGDPLVHLVPNWEEGRFWDSLAGWYAASNNQNLGQGCITSS